MASPCEAQPKRGEAGGGQIHFQTCFQLRQKKMLHFSMARAWQQRLATRGTHFILPKPDRFLWSTCEHRQLML